MQSYVQNVYGFRLNDLDNNDRGKVDWYPPKNYVPNKDNQSINLLK